MNIYFFIMKIVIFPVFYPFLYLAFHVLFIGESILLGVKGEVKKEVKRE